jgi:hypothetical protein
MIRRNILITEWDHQVVKWSLIAAAFALLTGAFAQNRIEVHAQDATSVVEAAPVAPVAPDSPVALGTAG